MPEYAIEWVQREYTTYRAYVHARTPKAALELAKGNLHDLDAYDRGFAKGDDAGPLPDSMECVGKVVGLVMGGVGVDTVVSFETPIRLASPKNRREGKKGAPKHAATLPVAETVRGADVRRSG